MSAVVFAWGQRSMAKKKRRRCIKGHEDGEYKHVQSDPSESRLSSSSAICSPLQSPGDFWPPPPSEHDLLQAAAPVSLKRHGPGVD